MTDQISLYLFASLGILVFLICLTWAILRLYIKKIAASLSNLSIRLSERDHLHATIQDGLQKQSAQISEQQINGLKTIIDSVQSSMMDIRQQISMTLNQNAEHLGKNVDKLTEQTQIQLKEITKLVEKQLFEGFEKSTTIFTDVIKRLALIDEAQKKITELSSNVMGLQDILNDKRSRGAFGEIQLESLIRNVIPQENFALQHTLSNGKRVDCMLFLPEPTGNIAIDAKFPLESYQKMADPNLNDIERKAAGQQFYIDIKKHIQDIAEKYIIEGQTASGALMFIPAEAIFAEIHANHPDLVTLSHRSKVWIVSPNTMMALLTTARAVLKDIATRKQIHIIQKHLVALSKNFERFQKGMDSLAKHITQIHNDVEEVQKSSQKITTQFNRIEQIELMEEIPDPE